MKKCKKYIKILFLLMIFVILKSTVYAENTLYIEKIAVFKDAVRVRANKPLVEITLYDEEGTFVARKIADENGEVIIYVNKFNNRDKRKSKVVVSDENTDAEMFIEDQRVIVNDEYFDSENSLSSIKKDKEVYPKNILINEDLVEGKLEENKDKCIKIYYKNQYAGMGYINSNDKFSIKINRKLEENEKLNFYIEDAHKNSELERKSYIIGYNDDTFRPYKNLTRAEASIMLQRLLLKDKEYVIPTEKYIDVKDEWYKDAVEFASTKGFIIGYPDKTFRPNKEISRYEFTFILSKYIDILTNIDEKENKIEIKYLEEAIEKIYGNKKIQGYPDGTFKAKENITRAEAITILNIAFGRISSTESIKKSANISKLKSFKDIKKDDWYYIDILDAANSHKSYRRSSSDDMEIWTEIKE